MRYGVLGIAVAMLVALGVNDALRATRLTEATSSVQAKLDAIPLTINDEWHGEAKPFDEKLIKATHAVAYRSIVYTRGGTKPASVSVLLLAGDPGEIGAHDPERCYGGTGYHSLGNRSQKQVPDIGVIHSLWSERFERETLPAGSVEVCWAWTDTGHWRAAEAARAEFGGRTILYKLYASRTLTAGGDGDDPILDLMTALAPVARTVLTGASP